MPSLPRALALGGATLALTATSLVTAVTVAPTAGAAAPPSLSWQLRDTGGTNHFRGLSPVSAKVAWLGGYNGQVLRTVDGGATWKDVSPQGDGVAGLQFRDIEATSQTHAVAMAAGEATDSRLYVTDDGGRTWALAYGNTEPAAFFDCMSFSDPDHGLVLSDPVDGKFRILSTSDGGHSWRVLPRGGMPKAQDGEFAFAASGQCLTTSGSDAWFGTGGGKIARIYHSTDGGVTWTSAASTLASTASGGVFGLAYNTPSRGVAVGGDFADSTARDRIAATQLAGGPWRPAKDMPHGYRSGVAWLPGTLGTVVAVGLTGSDVSVDGGKTWTTFDTGQFDTVSCTTAGACWAAGDLGRVAVLRGT